MKKTLLAILATVAMVACSNDEIVREAAPEAIGFDNAFVNNSTRSVNDPSYSNTNLFKNFAVYGFVEDASLFDNVQVSGTALNGDWTYTDKQYWITGAKYSFAAIAPYANGQDGVFSVTKDGENYVGTTVLPFSNAGTEVSLNGTNDVLYAQNGQYQAKATGQNDKVAFTFRHILSKVKFSFENAYPANSATIKVYDVKINNAYESATATLGVSSTAWTDQDGAIVINFGNASDNEATTDVEASADVAFGQNAVYESYNERFLIPGKAATKLAAEDKDGYKVTFKVDLLINGTKVKTYNHTAYANFVPVAGNAYDIKTSINAENIDPANEQEEIKFTVTTITDWDTDYNDTADGDNNVEM